MRSHEQIIASAGKDGVLAEKLGVNSHQVRDWRLRNSIPSEHWMALEQHKVATLSELAKAAAQRSAA